MEHAAAHDGEEARRVVAAEDLVARGGAERGEVGERSPRGMRAWFFDHGELEGFAHGTETSIGDALIPANIEYVGTDPAMEVHVASNSPTVMTSVPDAVFKDPDAR